jgi:hypothetical protein
MDVASFRKSKVYEFQKAERKRMNELIKLESMLTNKSALLVSDIASCGDYVNRLPMNDWEILKE